MTNDGKFYCAYCLSFKPLAEHFQRKGKPQCKACAERVRKAMRD